MLASPQSLNLILNALGVLLGGGALAAWLRFISNMRGLHNADEANIRDHYAKEVTAMREANMRLEKHFRDMIADIEKRHQEALETAERRYNEALNNHEECLRERRQLFDEIEGLKRQIARYSTDKLLELEDGARPSEKAPEAVAAARRNRTNGHH